MEHIEQTTFSEQLIEWGRSGSFYPNLLPSTESREDLQALQTQLQDQLPGADRLDNPHLTLFYLNPEKLFLALNDYCGGDVKEDYFYGDFASIFGTAALGHGFELPTRELDMFGDNHDILAVELDKTPEFELYTKQLRELAVRAIRRYGGDGDFIEDIASQPGFKRLLSGSFRPHVSLFSDVGETAGVDIDLPETFEFNGLNDGSVTAPTENPRQWYIIPTTYTR